MRDQLLEVKGQTSQLSEANSHLQKGINYQSQLLEAFIGAEKSKLVQDKIDRQPFFECWPNDNKHSPVLATIGLINTGKTAKNVVVRSARTVPDYIVNGPLNRGQISQGSQLEIPLKSPTNFNLRIEYEDVLGNKYMQICIGNWFNYSVLPATERKS